MGSITLRRALAASTVVALAITLIVLLPTLGGSASDRKLRTPPRFATWQYQLDGHVIPSSAAQVWDIDGYDTPKGVVTQLRKRGAYTICYFSAGTYERWRKDR